MARAAWFFPIPDESTLPDRLQSLFAKARERIGFLPNVFANYSYRPERFSAWFSHYHQLHEPTEHLDEADREMIAVVVSAWNRCTYCIVSHGHALRVALLQPLREAGVVEGVAARQGMALAGHGRLG